MSATATSLPCTTALSSDLRTAIATEHLTAATWALVVVGAATLIAAVVAAIIALKAYQLEDAPAVSISRGGHPIGTLKQPWILKDNEGTQDLTLEEFTQEAGRVRPIMFIQVRNVGRSSVLESTLQVRITAADRSSQSTLRIASIQSGETVDVPINTNVRGFAIVVVDMSALALGFGNEPRKKKRLRVVSADLSFGLHGE